MEFKGFEQFLIMMAMRQEADKTIFDFTGTCKSTALDTLELTLDEFNLFSFSVDIDRPLTLSPKTLLQNRE